MYRQYTQCYVHTPGDKPFNKSDLVGFVAGAAAPGLVVTILAFLAGGGLLGVIGVAVTYATTITAVANEWLYHRLVCVDGANAGPKCALGVIEVEPEVGDLGQFDNDQYFHLRLMPHRPGDEYRVPPGDGKTAAHPANDLYTDNFQAQALIRPTIPDLPYDRTLPEASLLHCEAEGNFWQAMKDYAALLGTAVAVGTGAGALAGAEAGCALGGFFGPIGCAIGAFIGAIAGALAGGGAAAYAGAQIAFHSDPGNVDDANVGDTPLGPLQAGDEVVVLGQHVYDGFHEGWHEFHPLMAIMKIPGPGPGQYDPNQYLEWNPDFGDGTPAPGGLTPDDMRRGLESGPFRARAVLLRDTWCRAVQEAFLPAVKEGQLHPVNRWTIHPAVDGCVIPEQPPPPH